MLKAAATAHPIVVLGCRLTEIWKQGSASEKPDIKLGFKVPNKVWLQYKRIVW